MNRAAKAAESASGGCDSNKPECHDRTERSPYAPGAQRLHGKQHDQDDNRRRNDVRREGRNYESRPSNAESTQIAGVIAPSP